jgi:hypothetical protein
MPGIKRTFPYDLAHPEFPHGTRTGFNHGCSRNEYCPNTPTCAQVRYKAAKRVAWREAGMLPLGDQDMVPSGPVRDHVRTLLAVPEAETGIVGQAAGVSADLVLNISRAKNQTVRVGTARKLLATTPAQVQALAPRRVNRRHIQLVRSMQIQGWSMEWQAAQLGRSAEWLINLCAGKTPRIPAKDHTALLALARRLETEWGPDRVTAGKARAAGWHPLLAYDEDGELIPGAVRDETIETRKAARYKAARDRLEVLRLSLEYHLAPGDIEARVGVKSDLIHKIRAEAGLKFETENGLPGTAQARRSVLRPECAKRGAEIRAILDAHYADCESDEYETALEIGLRRGLKVGQNLGQTDEQPPGERQTAETRTAA